MINYTVVIICNCAIPASSAHTINSHKHPPISSNFGGGADSLIQFTSKKKLLLKFQYKYLLSVIRFGNFLQFLLPNITTKETPKYGDFKGLFF